MGLASLLLFSPPPLSPPPRHPSTAAPRVTSSLSSPRRRTQTPRVTLSVTRRRSHRHVLLAAGGGSDENGNRGNGGDGGGDGDDNGGDWSRWVLFLTAVLCSAVSSLCHFRLASALERIASEVGDSVWEIRGGKWALLVPHQSDDAFVVSPSSSSSSPARSPWTVEEILSKCREVCERLMLPEGFPASVTSDYLDYSLWRAVQGVASQVSSVLATQALLYAVGLGKGAIPVAAAINWVLKDGIGYLSKIMLSKYGRHFDVNPKGWRLFADLLENSAFGLEMLTPAFPQLFVPIGAVAGAGRSAAALIQAATRSCFYAGFAAQRNFAEVIAKGEAQGMVSKSIGIVLGIGLANCVGSSTSLALVSFSVVTVIHMYCNLKSYQSIHIRTLNPYRASLVFSEYLISGQAPPIKEVNDEEPLFPAVPILNVKPATMGISGVLSSEAKIAAAEIENRLLLGSKLSDIINNEEDVKALFALYRNEGYILTEHQGRFCVVLKETCSQYDMLKAVFQINYLYWLEKNAGIESKSPFLDCNSSGRLAISLDYVEREFNHMKEDGEASGWLLDGLIARPLPNRIRLGNVALTSSLS